MCVFAGYEECRASETKEACGPWCEATGMHVCEWREDYSPPPASPQMPPPPPPHIAPPCTKSPAYPKPPEPPPTPFEWGSPPPPHPSLPAPPLFSQGWCPPGHPRCGTCPICENCTFSPGTCVPGYYGLHVPGSTTSGCFKAVNVSECGKPGVFASFQEVTDFFSVDGVWNMGDDVPCIGEDTGMHQPECGLPPSKLGKIPTAYSSGWYPVVEGGTPEEYELMYAYGGEIRLFPHKY